MPRNTLGSLINCMSPKNTRRFELRVAVWTLLWTAVWVTVLAGFNKGTLTLGATGYFAIAMTIALGVATILSFIRLLKESDELQRKINLEALAFSVGVGVVGGLTYELLAEAGVVDPDGLSFIIVAMMLSYCGAVIVGHLRYS